MSNYGCHNVSQGFHIVGMKFLITKGSIDRKLSIQWFKDQETGKAQNKLCDLSGHEFPLAPSLSMILEQICRVELQINKLWYYSFTWAVSSSKHENMEHKTKTRAKGRPQYTHTDRSISRKNALIHPKKRKRII